MAESCFADLDGTPKAAKVTAEQQLEGTNLASLVVHPRRLFNEETGEEDVRHKGPANSEPGKRKYKPRGDDRTTVLTASGKQVLSSDARLHLEKVKALRKRKDVLKNIRNPLEDEEEVARLEYERQLLDAKLAKIKEIRRLQAELAPHTSKQASEYQTEEDPEWQQSAFSGDSAEGGSSSDKQDISSQRKKKRTTSSIDTMSRRSETSEGSWQQEEFTKLQNDIALCKDFIRTQSGAEIPSESPLSEDLEGAKINRRLKIPPINQFDGSTDPSDFLNTFDGRMAFYGHSDVARCRFFCTCLQGTALKWFNNLAPRSIDSWSALKTKFRNRFSSNKKGGKITASLMTVRQKYNESLRDFLSRFRAEVAEIPNLIDELAINYLAAGVDKARHGQLLEEFFDKNPQSLQTALHIFEHRLTLQEAVGSIQTSRMTSPRWERDRDRDLDRNKDKRDKDQTRDHNSQWTSKKDQGQLWNSKKDVKDSTVNSENQATLPPRANRAWQPRLREERDYTKLNTEKATILAVLKTEPDFRPPRQMNP